MKLPPIHQEVFGRKAPRITVEANKDLKPITEWLGEESFTYIHVFASLAHPHVLPLFVPDKFLSKEFSYKTVSKGLTKVLKMPRNLHGHVFPFLVVPMP